ncbi:MAG: hypothetical protein HXX08_16655 [Chloroflexi bacterium]|uniref:non-specific serine/threonine protein kinase n=1 Tax=Candidatus Chlorohelix allophototropha TaxID=3003348 RepID=A0A8T7M689_9CHLR|nr:hypothetical protein [Chloroflexota bacterium]WJW69404.1 hypothetical protein OZ401_003012 [Chloroflexota bacterium L227-S17]
MKNKFNYKSEESELLDQFEQFNRKKGREEPESNPFEPYVKEKMITQMLRLVKSGKEAKVYCCEATPQMDSDYLALKVYIPRENRNFKNDATYREGRVVLNQHDVRAMRKKSEWGKVMSSGLWSNQEYIYLHMMYRAGADVPKPYAQRGNSILMEFLGEGDLAAPILNNVELENAEAKIVFERLMHNIELFLSLNIVHSDLSPFNVLYWQEQIRIIDFPQAVDARFNKNSEWLLERDITNLCRYFKRFGVIADPAKLSGNFWLRFQNSQF